jgi:transcriptional regulator with XRE-family HTH domain
MKSKNHPYHIGRTDILYQDALMPKRKFKIPTPGESFGKRLAELRQAAGYSQRDLAKETNVSQRMIAYYERENSYPPNHLLHIFAKALGVSTDQLLGLEKNKITRARDTRLWRRFSQVEKLPPAQRKQIVSLLDTFLKAGKS